MDKPLVIAVSRADAESFAPGASRRSPTSPSSPLLGAGAAFGLYRGQWRRKAFALLEASAERERRKTAEQLELALQGADLGLWDWDVPQRPLQAQRGRARASSATRPARSATSVGDGATSSIPTTRRG